MRKLTVLLMLLVAVSFAGEAISDLILDDFSAASSGYLAPIPLSKAVLFDQAYDGTINGARDYSDSIHLADDFSFTKPDYLERIEWWGVFTINVSTMDIRLHDDDGGLPGTVIWEQLGVTATITDTGDDYGGYAIYHIEVVLDPADYYLLDNGTTYWLSLHHDSTGAYWCRWNSGTAAESNNNGSTWGSRSAIYMLRLNGTEDIDAPAVSGQAPADGATGVAVNSVIVFHVTDVLSEVDTSTISFSVEDSAKSNGVSTSLSDRGSTGTITGTLVVDDTDPSDVICVFLLDSDLPPDTITCTVAAGLADDVGNATTSDIVWSFDTTGAAIEETTWGQIKAEF
jgi:hypothetical protein